MITNLPIIQSQRHFPKRTLRAAVIDIVDQQKISPFDINGDGLPDTKVTHAFVVQQILKRISPDTEVVPFDINLLSKDPQELIQELRGKSGESDFGAAYGFLKEQQSKPLAIVKLLEEIKRSNISGSTYHVVNLSLGTNHTIEEIGERSGLNLTNENLHEYRKELIDWLKNKSDDNLRAWHKAIVSLEGVIASGSRAYIAGMNAGRNGFNPLTLAEGAIAVGATDAVGNITGYSPQNSLIKEYKQGTYNVTEVYDGKRLTGYAIIEDGKVDIPVEMASDGIPVLKKISTNDVTVLKSGENIKAGVVYAREQLLKQIEVHMDRLKDFNPENVDDKQIGQAMSDFFFYNHLITRLKDSAKECVVFSSVEPEKLLTMNCFYFLDRGEKGAFCFNPDGSNRKAVGVIEGTSFASPRAAGEYLNKFTEE